MTTAAQKARSREILAAHLGTTAADERSLVTAWAAQRSAANPWHAIGTHEGTCQRCECPHYTEQPWFLCRECA